MIYPYTFNLGRALWLPRKIGEVKQRYSHVRVSIPARLATFPVRFENFVKGMSSRRYKVGDITFSIDLRTELYLEPRSSYDDDIVNEHKKRDVALHNVRIMQEALNLKNGFNIHIFQPYMNRVGLSTSSSIQAAVILGINKLYGDPISTDDIIKLGIYNYAEETSVSGRMVHVPILGGVLIEIVLKE